MKTYGAEFIGTFWLVLGCCGSAVLAATVPGGIRLLGVSLAFRLTVLTIACAVGPISGGHFNPAVSLGLWAAGASRLRSGVGPSICLLSVHHHARGGCGSEAASLQGARCGSGQIEMLRAKPCSPSRRR
jgi:hypothetical protein